MNHRIVFLIILCNFQIWRISIRVLKGRTLWWWHWNSIFLKSPQPFLFFSFLFPPFCSPIFEPHLIKTKKILSTNLTKRKRINLYSDTHFNYLITHNPHRYPKRKRLNKIHLSSGFKAFARISRLRHVSKKIKSVEKRHSKKHRTNHGEKEAFLIRFPSGPRRPKSAKQIKIARTPRNDVPFPPNWGLCFYILLKYNMKWVKESGISPPQNQSSVPLLRFDKFESIRFIVADLKTRCFC